MVLAVRLASGGEAAFSCSSRPAEKSAALSWPNAAPPPACAACLASLNICSSSSGAPSAAGCDGSGSSSPAAPSRKAEDDELSSSCRGAPGAGETVEWEKVKTEFG